MKTTIILAFAAGITLAGAQIDSIHPADRARYMRSIGLSMDRPATAPRKTEPRDYPMRAIPLSDPRFTAVYQAVLAAWPKKSKIPPPATVSDFSDRLQMGETYPIEKGKVIETCRKCQGAGRMHEKTPAMRTGDGKVECPDCKGIGKLELTLQLLVRW